MKLHEKILEYVNNNIVSCKEAASQNNVYNYMRTNGPSIT